MNPKHDLTEYVPLGQALMGFRGVGKWKGLRDRDLEFRCLHGAVQPRELADPGNAVIRYDLHAPPLLRLRFDSVRIGQSAATFERVKSSFQGIAARKSKDCIDAIWRKM